MKEERDNNMKAFIIGTVTAIVTVAVVTGVWLPQYLNRQYPIILDVTQEPFAEAIVLTTAIAHPKVTDLGYQGMSGGIEIEFMTGGVQLTGDPNLPDLVIVSDDTDFVPVTTAPSRANANSILLWRSQEDGDFMMDVGSGHITIISDAERLREMCEMIEAMHAIICAPPPELVATDGKGDDFNEDCFACVDPNYGLHFHYVWSESDISRGISNEH